MREIEDRTLIGWYQHREKCPKCMMNFYSFDGRCRTANCGNERQRDLDFQMSPKKDDRLIGKVWSRKSHKYLPIAKGGLKRC